MQLHLLYESVCLRYLYVTIIQIQKKNKDKREQKKEKLIKKKLIFVWKSWNLRQNKKPKKKKSNQK